jgi:hypothetical protein
MPIVFIHGVAAPQDQATFEISVRGVHYFLRDYIAREISDKPESVAILNAYWAPFGSSLAWNGASRPPSPLFSMGPEGAPPPTSQAITATEVGPTAGPAAQPGEAARPGRGLLPNAPPGGKAGPALRISSLLPDEMSDLLAAVARVVETDTRRHAYAAVAADELAHDPATRDALARLPDAAAEVAEIRARVARRAAELAVADGNVVGEGTPQWVRNFGDRLGEAAARVGSLQGSLLTSALAQVRGPANALVTRFFGDVFRYLDERGKPDRPGKIPATVITTLKKARAQIPANKEPLIVLSHSMGGQIVYDVVTAFLPADPQGQGVRVDFWCACASQVGLFEEMKRFLKSDAKYGADRSAKRVPYPDGHYLGAWWNVWDPNDFISYTARDIFEGVDDERYESGYSVLSAHGGYLEQPTFFRRFAQKLREAKQRGWR